MPEYSGYKGTAPVDFGGIAKQSMADILSVRQAEKKSAADAAALKKKNDEEYDKTYNLAIKEMAESVGVTADREFNDIVFEATSKGRDLQSEINKLVKSGNMLKSDAKKVYGKMSAELANWKIFKDNIGEVSKISTERITKGESSVLEQEESAWRGQLLNFNDKGASWSPNGELMFQTVDQEGNITKSQTAAQLVGQVQNFLVDRHEMSDITMGIVESGGSYKYVDGLSTITDPTQAPGYDKWMNRQVSAATQSNDPKTIAAIVLDNGLEYEHQMKSGSKELVSLYSGVYYNETQRDEKVEKQIQEVMEDSGRIFSKEEMEEIRAEIENLMIPVNEGGSGENKYSVNSKHKDLVREAIEKDVAFKLGYSESKRKPTTSGSGGGTPLQKETNKLITEYSNNSFYASGGYNSKFGGLNKRYFYKRNGNGDVEVYEKQKIMGGTFTNAEMVNKLGSLEPIFTATNPSQMADYAKTEASSAAKFNLGGGDSGDEDDPLKIN